VEEEELMVEGGGLTVGEDLIEEGEELLVVAGGLRVEDSLVEDLRIEVGMLVTKEVTERDEIIAVAQKQLNHH
jgi:hypothetical protein